jgi:Rhodopirellula transposase DDE domain
VIDVDDIRLRWQQAETFLDERDRRLLAANEALAHGYGGVSAVAQATGVARSTINRGIRELRLGRNDIGNRVRRAGGGRKSAVAHQPDLPAALERLIEDTIRGDPCSPLRWVSRSLRHLVKALAAQGFQATSDWWRTCCGN